MSGYGAACLPVSMLKHILMFEQVNTDLTRQPRQTPTSSSYVLL